MAIAAAWWGFAAGHALRRRFLPGGEEGSLVRRLLRLPAGLTVLLALYLGLKALFPAEGQALYLPLRFARYALAGTWIALGAPLLFRRIGLASPALPAFDNPGRRTYNSRHHGGRGRRCP